MSKYHSTQVELAAMATAGKEIKVDHSALSITLTQDVISSMLYEYAAHLREREAAKAALCPCGGDAEKCPGMCQELQPLVIWRSMQSAPRDGSVILLRWGEDAITPGWWSGDVTGAPHEPSDEYLWKFIDAKSAQHGQYFINTARDNEYGPSHWAPYQELRESVAPMLASARVPDDEWLKLAQELEVYKAVAPSPIGPLHGAGMALAYQNVAKTIRAMLAAAPKREEAKAGVTDAMVNKAFGAFLQGLKGDDGDTLKGLRFALEAVAPMLASARVPDGWQPTPANINALPLPIRKYIMMLETEADPAGTIRQNVLVSEENDMLRAALAEALAAAPKRGEG